MKKLPNEIVYTDGNSYFDALLRDIAHAKHSIFLETYIYAADETGIKVTHALLEAAKRGVKVRVLVDGAGSFLLWDGQLKSMLETAGAETRVFHPFPWHIDGQYHHFGLFSVIGKFMQMFLIMNSRNHRKTCIIDKRIIHIGSMNISHCHIGTSPQMGWRDTAVRLEDKPCNTLIEACEQAWQQRRFYAPLRKMVKKNIKNRKHAPINDNPIIRLNHTWKLRRVLYKSLLRRMNKSQTRIWIISAYFVPDNMVIRRLIKAAKRGIDVRILVPEVSDVRPMAWISASFYPILLKHNVKIYEYHPKMMHAKTIIIDDWFIVGSSNLNHRSMFHDLEVDILLQSEEAKTTIIKQFQQDLKHSHAMQLNNLSKRPFLARLIGRFLALFKHWL